MKPRLFITQPIFAEHEQLLAEHFDLTVNLANCAVISEQALLEGLADCNAVFCRLGDPLTARVIHGAARLRLIATMASRPSHINMDAARERDVRVIVRPNCPGVDNTTDTAELAVCLMLALARNIVPADSGFRRGEFPGPQNHRYSGISLDGAQLGLLGMGAVARSVIRKAQGLGMHVSYWSRSRHHEEEQAYGITYKQFPELLKTSDIVSLHLNSAPETYHLMNAENLALMKQGALFVNTARGDIADTPALWNVLRSGHLGGVALDVYEDEPCPHLPVDLLDCPRLLVTPHIGSAVQAKRFAMESVVCSNIIAQVEWLMAEKTLSEIEIV